MVTRKTSLPYPTSPPPPPPAFDYSRPDHDIDSSDVPPVPAVGSRMIQDSAYGDMGNPWNDDTPEHIPQSRPPVPDILKPAKARAASPKKSAASDIPDILKPGWSGENTPRSSIDSQRSKDFWESSDDEQDEKPEKQEKHVNVTNQQSGSQVPASLQIRRKPIGLSPTQESTVDHSSDFASNNPFRKGSVVDVPERTEDTSQQTNSKGKGKAVERYEISNPQTEPYSFKSSIPDLSAYSTEQAKLDYSPWDNVPSEGPPPPPHAAPPPVPVQLPPQIPEISSPFSSQPPLIPVSPNSGSDVNPWMAQRSTQATPSPIPFSSSQKNVSEYTMDLLDRGQHAAPISLGDELKALPNHGPATSSKASLLDEMPAPSLPERRYKNEEGEVYAPPPGPPPSHARAQLQDADRFPSDIPPVKPPRPAIITKVPTEQELAQMREQRNETYQVKHFNWFDQKSGGMRSSSMLTQNKNGPCPLLALVNALILSANGQDQAAMDEFLRTREQVTLGTIIENLMIELLSAASGAELPDVDELNRFLLKLRTGMNMNPRFVQPPEPAPNLMDARNSMLHLPTQQESRPRPGGFETTQDINLYGAFGVQTVHGWLPDPGSDAAKAFARSAQSYEDAQAKLFGEDELEYKLSNDGLSQQEQTIWEDIVAIKTFLSTYPSQLTKYGLHCIGSSMLPGSFAILFRNDHFSTLYKHPHDGKLYTLVTDAGYHEKDEIIWESLVDVSGQHSEFFSGDFKSVSHENPSSRRGSSIRQADHLHANDPSHFDEALSPQERQEQNDADYAMALQMQLEEEEDQRRRRAQSQSNNPSTRPTGGRRSTGNIPIPLRSNNPIQEVRPLIPPRNTRSNVQAVNRPADADQSDAPPAYEEAARHRPYNPPIGSPLHPQSSATPEGSPFNSTSQINIQDPAPSTNRPAASNRRSSAYTENHDRMGGRPNQGTGRYEMGMSPAYDLTDGRMPGSYLHTGRGGHGQSAGLGGNQVPRLGRPGASQVDRDRDCIVM